MDAQSHYQLMHRGIAQRAARTRWIAIIGYLIYGLFVWTAALSAFPQIEQWGLALLFWPAYLLLTWSMMTLMAAKRRPRWWGFVGLLGPISLLLYFVPEQQKGH
jgi:hypothetical protein